MDLSFDVLVILCDVNKYFGLSDDLINGIYHYLINEIDNWYNKNNDYISFAFANSADEFLNLQIYKSITESIQARMVCINELELDYAVADKLIADKLREYFAGYAELPKYNLGVYRYNVGYEIWLAKLPDMFFDFQLYVKTNGPFNSTCIYCNYADLPKIISHIAAGDLNILKSFTRIYEFTDNYEMLLYNRATKLLYNTIMISEYF